MMSHEQRQPDQQVQVAQADQLEQPKDKWGDSISEQRQQELLGMLDAWNAPDADHGKRRGPFDGRELTGADVYCLAEKYDEDLVLLLEGALLYRAQLQGADLSEAQLQGAYLLDAQLEGADLSRAWLQGAYLFGAKLEGADFSGATLDGKSTLANAFILAPEDTRPLRARLFRRPRYGPALGDLHWGDFDMAQLTQLHGWDDLRRLADERGITWRSDAAGHRDALRAYLQVAQRLREQGYSYVADRAQVLQRKLLFRLLLADWRRPWRLPGDLVRWLFSWFLALLAGYGYHPGRSVFWYLATIASFTYAFFQATHGLPIGPFHFAQSSDIPQLPWNEALILSVSAFHGRGFFQPVKSLGDPVAGLAALEAVLGLIIEISFIATFTQRFFGAK